jgi:dethiobiotin synthetase
VRIDPRRIAVSTRRLAKLYDNVLIEGVGGSEVPLTKKVTTLDYMAKQGYRVIVVSSTRLGSINHTLLTLRALHAGGLHVLGIVYNQSRGGNRTIAEDTRRVLLRALKKFGYPATIIDLPFFANLDRPPDIDFAPLLGNRYSVRPLPRRRTVAPQVHTGGIRRQ